MKSWEEVGLFVVQSDGGRLRKNIFAENIFARNTFAKTIFMKNIFLKNLSQYQGLCRLGSEFFSNGPENIYPHQSK